MANWFKPSTGPPPRATPGGPNTAWTGPRRGGPEAGFALPLVLMVIVIVVLLGTAFATIAETEKKISDNQAQAVQAAYAADAGVEAAHALLRGGELPQTPGLWIPLTSLNTAGGAGIGEYEVEVVSVGDDTVEIRASGYVPSKADFQAKKTVTVTFHGSPDGGTVLPIFRNAAASQGALDLSNSVVISGADVYAQGNVILDNSSMITGGVFTSGKVDMQNSARITGDLFANGALNMKNTATVVGDVTANGSVTMENSSAINGSLTTHGTLTLKNSAHVDGEVTEGAPETPFPWQSFPGMDSDALAGWKALAQQGGSTPGDASYSGDVTLGSHYFGGNLRFTNSGKLTLQDNAVVYVEGNITVKNSVIVTVVGNGTIITPAGTITVENSSEIKYGTDDPGTYSLALISVKSGGTGIEIQNSAKVHGILWAPNSAIEFENSARIYGCAVGNSLDADNSTQITYDTRFGQVSPPVVGDPGALVWGKEKWEE